MRTACPFWSKWAENYRIDMADFEAKLPQAEAVIISHMRGHTSDMDAILALCAKAGVPVLEDAAIRSEPCGMGRRSGLWA